MKCFHFRSLFLSSIILITPLYYPLYAQETLDSSIESSTIVSLPVGELEDGDEIIQNHPVSVAAKEEAPAKQATILPEVDQDLPCCPQTDTIGYEINFQNIQFVEYLHFLTKLTNTNFVYNAADLDFTVSIIADSKTDLKDIRSALLQMLAVKGLTLIEQGNNVVITTDPALRSIAPVVSDEMGNVCSANTAFVTRVFPLKNVNATKMAAIVTSMLSATALVEASDLTHHLIVTDVLSNVQKVADLLRSLDNPSAAFEIGTYHVEQAFIESIVALAEKILEPIAEGNSLVLVPQLASETVFVVSTPYLVQKTLEVLKSLDVGGGESNAEGFVANARFLVYKLQHHRGDQIQKTLQDMGSELSGTDSFNSQFVTTINTAQWVQSTNSMLFVGDPQSLKKIKELLKVLDAPLRQVFIEVLAVRTTINNSLNLGVEYGYRSKASNRVSTVGSLYTSPTNNVGGNLSKPLLFSEGLDRATSLIPVPRTENALGFSSGVIGNVMFAGSNLYFDLAALVNALQTDQNTQVISNPKLVTQDTIPATFYVGSTRPFQTNSILQASGSQSGNFVTASVEYRQLGMTLTVTPYLGNGNIITLEIEQKSSDYVQNAISSNSSSSDNFAIVPVTTDSSLTTRVHIPDKHFLMISGMIEDVKTASKSALPCLGGIPFAGDLFGSKANSIQKDNLIIFLRPHIIDTVQELDELTQREDEFYRKKSGKGSFMKNSFKLYNMQ